MKEYTLIITTTRRVTEDELVEYAHAVPWHFTPAQYKEVADIQGALSVRSPDGETIIEVRHVQ